MATLVLTTVGSIFGGAIGTIIGAVGGAAIDSLIFKPKGRTGPRLADLDVQTSRYGATIPKVFGTMRVAGTVIWATDLKESSAKQSGGKGQPSLTTFSYSASLAIALSSRPIQSIGRIWADGKLLRGTAGDFKTPLGAMRLHNGANGQAVDPLIAAAVGLDQAPAHRGLAYLVLEDLQLADFGNRIPSLTVEVVADSGEVSVSTIAADLLAHPVSFAGGSAPMIKGYAAEGEDVGGTLAPLIDIHRLIWRNGGSGPALAASLPTGRVIRNEESLRWLDGKEEPDIERLHLPLDDVPIRLSIRHYDQARDYQLGVQSSQRPGAGVRVEELAVPVVMTADGARDLADAALRTKLAGRRMAKRTGPWSLLDLEAGDLVAMEGEPGLWALDLLEWHDMAPRLSLRAVPHDGATMPVSGDAGRLVAEQDLEQGPTALALVELAPPTDSLVQAPLVFAAATGASEGWRRAALFRYHADTEMAEPIGRTAPRAILGTSSTILGAGAPWAFDLYSHVDILLDHVLDSLPEANDEELLRGANLCALGDELLQFGKADLIAPGHYRLTRLVRGWHGTEWAMTDHGTGERFVLLDADHLIGLATTPADVGQPVMIQAVGPGDASPAIAQRQIDGRAILPPMPVHIQVEEIGADLELSWTRRSRQGWLWRDLTDAPLAEESERYRVTIMAGTAMLRDQEVTVPSWTYDAAAKAADMITAGSAPVRLIIQQIGTFGPSAPLTLNLS